MLQEFPPLCARCYEQIVDTEGSICGTCADDLRQQRREYEARTYYDQYEAKMARDERAADDDTN